MTETVYKPWEDDSQHTTYDTANLRRVALFDQKIEGLQVKVKRTSEGKFIVKTRVPVPPKPVAKKKAPAKKTAKATTSRKTSARTKSTSSDVKETPASSPAKTATTKKKTTRKTSRKRK